MANVTEKFGLRPYRKLDGTPLVGAQNRYTIASGYSDAIFQGEMVQLLKSQHSVIFILAVLLLVILLHSSLTIQMQYF